MVASVPHIDAAAALSAESVGAFAPPPGVARLVLARDNDAVRERAAMRLARPCPRARVAAIVIGPGGGDFSNVLV